jgi:hypothetical protein
LLHSLSVLLLTFLLTMSICLQFPVELIPSLTYFGAYHEGIVLNKAVAPEYWFIESIMDLLVILLSTWSLDHGTSPFQNTTILMCSYVFNKQSHLHWQHQQIPPHE